MLPKYETHITISGPLFTLSTGAFSEVKLIITSQGNQKPSSPEPQLQAILHANERSASFVGYNIAGSWVFSGSLLEPPPIACSTCTVPQNERIDRVESADTTSVNVTAFSRQNDIVSNERTELMFVFHRLDCGQYVDFYSNGEIYFQLSVVTIEVSLTLQQDVGSDTITERDGSHHPYGFGDLCNESHHPYGFGDLCNESQDDKVADRVPGVPQGGCTSGPCTSQIGDGSSTPSGMLTNDVERFVHTGNFLIDPNNGHVTIKDYWVRVTHKNPLRGGETDGTLETQSGIAHNVSVYEIVDKGPMGCLKSRDGRLLVSDITDGHSLVSTFGHVVHVVPLPPPKVSFDDSTDPTDDSTDEYQVDDDSTDDSDDESDDEYQVDDDSTDEYQVDDDSDSNGLTICSQAQEETIPLLIKRDSG